MIISKTPFRISFFGGGTDLPSFYKNDYGAVVGAGIDKYMFVSVNKRFEENVRVSYSVTEIVNDASQVSHNLIREALTHFKLLKHIEVVTIADLPGSGTGLGSSSSTIVGLINALAHYVHHPLERKSIANTACEIEIEKLGYPIGKQDQFLACYGGINYLRFNSDGVVNIEPIHLPSSSYDELQQCLISFYTGISRDSNAILREQNENTPQRMDVLRQMRDQAESCRSILKKGDLTKFGEMLNEAWRLKQSLSDKISNSTIEKIYEKCLKAGALGGKLSGAGGGGFLTLFCEPRHQKMVKESLSDLLYITPKIDPSGTRIVYSE